LNVTLNDLKFKWQLHFDEYGSMILLFKTFCILLIFDENMQI
jgi:hypothetical protein